MVEEIANQILNQGSDFAIIATTVSMGAKKFAENNSDYYVTKFSEYMD